MVTNHEAQAFPMLRNLLPESKDTEPHFLFDRILCDVPCSGERSCCLHCATLLPGSIDAKVQLRFDRILLQRALLRWCRALGRTCGRLSAGAIEQLVLQLCKWLLLGLRSLQALHENRSLHPASTCNAKWPVTISIHA